MQAYTCESNMTSNILNAPKIRNEQPKQLQFNVEFIQSWMGRHLLFFRQKKGQPNLQRMICVCLVAKHLKIALSIYNNENVRKKTGFILYFVHAKQKYSIPIEFVAAFAALYHFPQNLTHTIWFYFICKPKNCTIFMTLSTSIINV